ncbi:MAG: hypothetical protein ACYSSI_08205 [Planctomycetota bacterium]
MSQKMQKSGTTIIETMVTIAVIIVGIIGAMYFRYHSALDTRKADVQITASRIGLTLLDTWKGSGGFTDYNPEIQLASVLSLSDSTGPDTPVDFTSLGSYHTLANRLSYYITLSYKDEADKRILNVCVGWQGDHRNDTLGSGYRFVKFSTYTSI